MSDKFEKRFLGEEAAIFIDGDPSKTEIEFQYILFLCQKNVPIGSAALDSFLGGSDIEKRISLVEREAVTNEYLRGELIYTVGLNQSNNWTESQFKRICAVAGVEPIYDMNIKKKMK